MIIYTGTDTVTVKYSVDVSVYDTVYLPGSIDNFNLWYRVGNVLHKAARIGGSLNPDGSGFVEFTVPTAEVGAYSYRIELSSGNLESIGYKAKRLAVGSIIRPINTTWIHVNKK